MTKKNLLGLAAAGAAAAIAVYFIRRNKGKIMEEVTKAGGKMQRHMTNVFHNAKEAAQVKLGA